MWWIAIRDYLSSKLVQIHVLQLHWEMTVRGLTFFKNKLFFFFYIEWQNRFYIFFVIKICLNDSIHIAYGIGYFPQNLYTSSSLRRYIAQTTSVRNHDTIEMQELIAEARHIVFRLKWQIWIKDEIIYRNVLWFNIHVLK